MDWYTPPEDGSPPPEPPISKGRCFWQGLVPPVLHFLLINFVAIFVTTPVTNALLKELEHTGLDYWGKMALIVSSPEYWQAIMEATFYSGLIAMALFYFLYRRRKQPPAPARARGALSLYPVIAVIGIAGNFFFVSSITAIQDLLGTELPTSSLEGITEDLASQIDPIFLTLFSLAIIFIAPIAEELCFRGLAFTRLTRAFPFWTANVIQAAFFGIIHITPIQIGYSFLFGLLLGWIYHRTGRLGSVVFCHIVFNFSNILLPLIPHISPLMESSYKMLLFIGLPAAAVLAFGVRTLGRATQEP